MIPHNVRLAVCVCVRLAVCMCMCVCVCVASVWCVASVFMMRVFVSLLASLASPQQMCITYIVAQAYSWV